MIASRSRPWLAAFALYSLAAVVGTWPLALRISTHLPLGSLSNATVPFFNLWTLEWNVRSLARGYSGYWDAPIFYPTPGTFALSEAQALTGLGFAALTAAVSGVTAYNLVLLMTLIANALAARRLMRVLGAVDSVATASGLLALGLPFVWKELGVLQLTVLWPVWLAWSELAILSGAEGVLAEAGEGGSSGERGGLLPRASGDSTRAVSSSGASGDAARFEPETRALGFALVRLAVWCAAIVWTCTYYALFSSVFLLLAAGMFARRAFVQSPLRGATLLALLVLLVAAYPLMSQQRVVGSYTRSTKTIHDGGATLRAYTRLPRGALGGEVVPSLAAKTDKRSLYPGTVLLLCAGIGIWSRSTRRRHVSARAVTPARDTPPTSAGADAAAGGDVAARTRVPGDAPTPAIPRTNTASRRRRPWLAVRRVLSRSRGSTRFFLWCGIGAVLALVLSFGARWSIGSFRPYEVIVERHLPGFGNARSPYRFAVFVQVFALVFAGVGLEALRRAAWRGRPPGRWRGLLLLAAAAVGCAEAMTIEARLERFPVEALHESWIEYLAAHPGGAVAMVPPALSGKAEAFEPTTVAMFQALQHGHPLLNGYSGFFPRIADAYIDALKEFPSQRTKRLISRVPVRYAVVEKAWLGSRPHAQLEPLTRVFDSPTHAIYLVPDRSR